MRHKRAKAYKKQMNVYQHAFGFREPYQVLLDDGFVAECAAAAYNLTNGLSACVLGAVKPMITQCCMQALYASRNSSAIDLAKTLERRRCNHSHKDPKTPDECILLVALVDGKNKHRYVVATQSRPLRKALKAVPGVPLLFINRSVFIMEPVLEATTAVAQEKEQAKLTAGLNARAVGYEEKKRGPKQPNPLSNKRKREEPQKKKLRRHKKRREGESQGAGDTTSET